MVNLLVWSAEVARIAVRLATGRPDQRPTAHHSPHASLPGSARQSIAAGNRHEWEPHFRAWQRQVVPASPGVIGSAERGAFSADKARGCTQNTLIVKDLEHRPWVSMDYLRVLRHHLILSAIRVLRFDAAARPSLTHSPRDTQAKQD